MADFVANNSTNFTLYYNILEYFRIIMKNHPSLARVTQGDNFDVDTDEFPRYPLGNVMITDVRFMDKVTNYNVQLIVADKVKLKNNQLFLIKSEIGVPVVFPLKTPERISTLSSSFRCVVNFDWPGFLLSKNV